MRRELNAGTQPFREMPVFNNWGVVARAWYAAMPSRELRVGRARSTELCGQRVVLWRGGDGRVRATDAFCPHMGTDLGIGRVRGNDLSCFFHRWTFDGGGTCVDIPCQPGEIPAAARLQSYAVEEKYGLIWIYPEAVAPSGVVEFDELAGGDVTWALGAPYERTCHPHVTMINGIDPQHLRTVHGFSIEMALELRERPGGSWIDFTLSGELGSARAGTRPALKDRVARAVLGARYEYTMRYAGGSVGALTLMREVRPFNGNWVFPRLHMLFAYVPLGPGRTLVRPIFVARRRRGLLGQLRTRALLGLTRLLVRTLQSEDGAVYENMRFSPQALLPIDAPVAKFIQWVNRLEPSRWSRAGAR